jgi:hypothetical protein
MTTIDKLNALPNPFLDQGHIARKRRTIAAIEGRHGYSAAAVNAAIASSNRAGKRIGKREAALIHSLLKGR